MFLFGHKSSTEHPTGIFFDIGIVKFFQIFYRMNIEILVFKVSETMHSWGFTPLKKKTSRSEKLPGRWTPSV